MISVSIEELAAHAAHVRERSRAATSRFAGDAALETKRATLTGRSSAKPSDAPSGDSVSMLDLRAQDPRSKPSPRRRLKKQK